MSDNKDILGSIGRRRPAQDYVPSLDEVPDLAAEQVELDYVEHEEYAPGARICHTVTAAEPASDTVEIDITDMILAEIREFLPGSFVHYGDYRDVRVRVAELIGLKLTGGRVIAEFGDIDLDAP